MQKTELELFIALVLSSGCSGKKWDLPYLTSMWVGWLKAQTLFITITGKWYILYVLILT